MRSGVTFWISIAVFLAVIAGYGVAGLLLSRGTSRRASLARRYGVIGGIAVGAAWFAVLEPTPGLKGLVFIPLAVTLLGPAAVAVLAARAARSSSAGTRPRSGQRSSEVWFAVWVTVTYVNEGRPYDAGLVRDFHSSGAPDLATYAVGDDLGSGLVLLVLVPTVALALGSLAARLDKRHG